MEVRIKQCNPQSSTGSSFANEDAQFAWAKAKLEYMRYQQDRDTRYKALLTKRELELEAKTMEMLDNNAPIEEIVAYGIDNGIYKNMRGKVALMVPVIMANLPAVVHASQKASKAIEGAEAIREAFDQLISVATAVAEPILWFYALGACIMMATGKNKQLGWERLKNVGYAYIVIALLPTGFAFLRWVADLIRSSANF